MSGLTLRYSLTEQDLMALTRYVRRYRARRALVANVVSVGVIFFLVMALAIWGDTREVGPSLIAGTLLAVLVVPLYVLYLRSFTRRQVARQAADPQFLEEREVQLSAGGFRERTSINDSFHAWEGLEAVALTDSHLFVHLNAVAAYIVPRSTLSPDALDLIRASTPPAKFRELA